MVIMPGLHMSLEKRGTKTMKMYKKSDLKLVNGMLVTESGDIIVPDITIVDQANALETAHQKAMYLAKQPSAQPMPSLDGFNRVSIKDANIRFTADTPIMDSKIDEAMEIMNELDDMATVVKANVMLRDFKALVDFVQSDMVVDCEGYDPYYFDTPTLGSVLELTIDDVVSVVADCCGMVKECLTAKPETQEDEDMELPSFRKEATHQPDGE